MLIPAFCARGLTSLPHPPKTIQCEWKDFQAKHGLLFYEDLSSPSLLYYLRAAREYFVNTSHSMLTFPGHQRHELTTSD